MYSTELAIVHRTGNSLLDMASPVLRNFHVAAKVQQRTKLMSLSKFLLLQNYKCIASAFPGQAYNVPVVCFEAPLAFLDVKSS